MLCQFVQAENLGNVLWNSSKFIRINTRELFSLKVSKKMCVLPLCKIWLTDIYMKINQHKYTFIATSHRAGWEQKCYRTPRVYLISPSLVFSLILLIFQNSRQPHQSDTAMGHIRHESKSPLTLVLQVSASPHHSVLMTAWQIDVSPHHRSDNSTGV